ncbi:MAG: hypothetical protein JNM17_15515 [Archangium sp.]|nr:hypothetical protein [Archangium sp.]
MLAAISLVSVLLASNPYLDEGRRHFDALEFEAANASLTVAVQQSSLTTEERRTAFDLQARALLALNRKEDAIAAYARLLERDPYAPQPSGAPKVIDAFLRGREKAWPKPSVKWSRAADPEAGAIKVELQDPWALVMRARYFESSKAGLSEHSAQVIDHSLVVRPSPSTSQVLFDALDANGTLLAHFEVPVTPTATQEPAATPLVRTTSATPPSSLRTPGIVALIAGLATVAAGAIVLGFGYGPAPTTLTSAGDINAWNRSVTGQVGAGWALASGGAALSIVGGVLLAF